MVTNKTTQGFEPPVRFAKPGNENDGPAIVFADSTQTIFLADMTGDGLTDIVRIRHRSVCYWPNMGYGRFGKQIIMNNPPQLDTPDLFHPRRIRLADVDGSGTTDIIYMNGTKTRYWKNLSGNRWSEPVELNCFPASTDMDNLSVVDLMGNGTSCLVWSSPMPSGQRQVRYVELTNGTKPHLLTQVDNNMGAITRLQYAPSTKFYLRDKQQGKPWITRLPFPVQVLERVETLDQITQSRFVTLYGYHHGYFDGVEREFRGFGMVEQWDSEQYANANNTLFDVVGANIDESSFVPPVYTKTWFHTGFYRNRNEISNHYKTEYFSGDNAAWLLPDTLLPEGLSAAEAREACRALKGSVLRQEIYALDDTTQQATPYTVEEKSYRVERLQPLVGKAHALFLVTADQALAYHYERNAADPRILHTLTLETDTWGNVLKSAQVAYPRRNCPEILPEQQPCKVVVTQNQYINQSNILQHRIGVLCQTQQFKLTGVATQSPFTVQGLNTAFGQATEIDYATAPTTGIQKRCFAHSRTWFYNSACTERLPLGQIAAHGLVYKGAQAAFTDGMIDKMRANHNNPLFTALTTNQIKELLTGTQGGYANEDSLIWLPTARLQHDTQKFFLPTQQTDALGNATAFEYDTHALFVVKVTDAESNETHITHNYKHLQPQQVIDINQNHTQTAFSPAGLVVAIALKGKQLPDSSFEGDTLTDPTEVFEYNFHNWQQNQQPNVVVNHKREKHGQFPWQTAQSQPLGEREGWISTVVYSDGLGNQTLTKAQAENGKALTLNNNTLAETTNDITNRWAASSRAIYNNKGMVSQQFEPYFADSSAYDQYHLATNAHDFVHHSRLSYDPVGRNIRTDMPDGTFVKTVFDAWKQENWDANDNTLQSQWYTNNGAPNPQATEPTNAAQRAAWLAAQHAATPQVVHFDNLGRPFRTDDDNKTETATTKHQLDIAGNQTQMTDALGRQATTNHYNLVGQIVTTQNIDSGTRTQLHNAAGQPFLQWDSRGNKTNQQYDNLLRPTQTLLTTATQTNVVTEKTEYGTSAALNSKGKPVAVYAQDGKTVFDVYDFKGNVVSLTKIFAVDYQTLLDWSTAEALQTKTYQTQTQYDAMNRPVQQTQPDSNQTAYHYNKAGLLERVLHNQTEYVSNVNYNAKGQRTFIHYGNGTNSEFVYNSFNFRLEQLVTNRISDSKKLQHLNYTFDAVGNIVQINDTAHQTVYFNNAAVNSEGKYTYDALYRLKTATGRELLGLGMPGNDDFINTIPNPNDSTAVGNYTQYYNYDKLGNFLEMQHVASLSQHCWTREYYYNQNNNYLLGHSLQNPDYTYDAHGNVTSMPHLPVMEWDTKNQLIKTGNGTMNAIYCYDSTNNRSRKVVEKQNGNIREERLYFGNYELFRKYISNVLVTERTTNHISDGTKRIALVDVLTVDNEVVLSTPISNIRYQYDNHLGSASLELDENASIISYEEYHPFGTTSYRSGRTETEVSLKRYKYVGKERDEETGLYYYGARNYAAWLGRFISPDPEKEKRSWLNPYNYVQNNTLIRIDPDGALDEDPRVEHDRVHIEKMQAKSAGNLSDTYKGKTFYENSYINFSSLAQYEKWAPLSDKESIIYNTIGDLKLITGLNLRLDDKNRLTYEIDPKTNNPIINEGVTSSKAREDLLSVIHGGKNSEEKSILNVAKYPKENVFDPNSGYVGLNETQTQSFIDNSSNYLNNKTMGFGMTFLHEILHSPQGGLLKDPQEGSTSFEGTTVGRVNEYRAEMGADWGQRMLYQTTSNFHGNIIIPFNLESLNIIQDNKEIMLNKSNPNHLFISKKRK